MIRKVTAALIAVFALSALPAVGQNTGPVRTVPNTGPVRTVPNSPAPNQVAPDQAVPDTAVPGDAAPAPEGSRFVFHRVQDSFVRLDSRTGQVSLCSRRTVGWTCQVAPDDRSLLENEIARLRGDNALLKKELLARGLPLPGGLKSTQGPQADKSPQLRLPTGADFDRVVAFIGKAWRRLVEMIADLQKDVMKKS